MKLSDALKEKGLDLTEDAAKMALEAILDYAADYAVKSENKYDDVLLVLIPVLKPILLEMIDKIDGEEG